MAKVLFVDDQVNILKALNRAVEDEDIEVFTAESGQKGLEFMKEHEFDVIFSDVRMPEMDGIQFLSKSRDIHPDSVRIVLSAFAEREEVLNVVNKGFIWSYQVKPWEDEDLILTLRNARAFHEKQIENSRLAAELQKSYEQLNNYNEELEQRVWERTKELEMREKALKMFLDKKDLNHIKAQIESDLKDLSKADSVELGFKKSEEVDKTCIEMWRQNFCLGYIILSNAPKNTQEHIEGYLPIVEIFMSMWKVTLKKDTIMSSIDNLLEALDE
ncbi:MAG: response regulator [Lentisphaerales bacterium]|nr:response regulator [Lentisphaerales bacterium]